MADVGAQGKDGASDDEPSTGQKPDTVSRGNESPVEVSLEFVDALPGGRSMMPIEREGKFVWLAVHGEIKPRAAQEMVDDLNYMVRTGLWQQAWHPPQPGS